MKIRLLTLSHRNLCDSYSIVQSMNYVTYKMKFIPNSLAIYFSKHMKKHFSPLIWRVSRPLICRRNTPPVSRSYHCSRTFTTQSYMIAQLHQKTMRKYETKLNKIPMETITVVENQFRAQPTFLKNALRHSRYAYFCHTNDQGVRELKRFSRGKDSVIIASNMSTSCEVRDLIPAPPSPTPLLALIVSSDGRSNIFIIEEESGEVVSHLESGHQIQWVSPTEFFYTLRNEHLRPDTVMFLDVATGEKTDVYRSAQPNEVVSVTTTKDKLFTAINVNTKFTSHIHLLKEGSLKCHSGNVICDRSLGVKCYVEHCNGRIILLKSASDHQNLAFYLSPPLVNNSELPDISSFTRIPFEMGVIHEMEVFDEGIVVYHTPLTDTHGWDGYRLTLLDPRDLTRIKSHIIFPADICLIAPKWNTSSSQTHLNVVVHSLTKPAKEMSIPFSRFSVSRMRLITEGQYDMRRENVSSEGGVQIPLTLIGKADTLDRMSPTLFLVYGCYGDTTLPWLELLPRDLLDSSWKIALCHVRGGGELGRDWYCQGVGGNKDAHTVTDTVHCISHLHSLQLSAPHSSVLHSTSAGGAIAVRALRQNPHLVHKLVLRFPFFQPDPYSALYHEEVEEWDGMSDWNDGGKLCAEMFITVGGADRRAPPSHVANFLSSLENTDNCYVNYLPEADHSGFDEEAYRLENLFILDQSVKESGWFKPFLEGFFRRILLAK